MGLLKAAERDWCRTRSSPNASFRLKHHSGSFLVGFRLFLKLPGQQHRRCRKWFSIFSMVSPRFPRRLSGGRTCPDAAGRLGNVSGSSGSQGPGCKWAGEIQAPANHGSNPFMFPSCSIADKRSFPTQILRDPCFFAARDAPAAPGLWLGRTAVSLSCLYVSSSRISSVWAKDSGCSAASAAAFSVSSRLLILNGLERTELGGGAEILHTLDFWHSTSDRGWFSCCMFKAEHGFRLSLLMQRVINPTSLLVKV